MRPVRPPYHEPEADEQNLLAVRREHWSIEASIRRRYDCGLVSSVRIGNKNAITGITPAGKCDFVTVCRKTSAVTICHSCRRGRGEILLVGSVRIHDPDFKDFGGAVPNYVEDFLAIGRN